MSTQREPGFIKASRSLGLDGCTIRPGDIGVAVIRPYREYESSALVRIAGEFPVARWMSEDFAHPSTLADAESWIAETQRHDPLQGGAIEVDGQLAGGVGLESFTGSSCQRCDSRLLARRSRRGPRHCDGRREADRREWLCGWSTAHRSTRLREKRRIGASARKGRFPFGGAPREIICRTRRNVM